MTIDQRNSPIGISGNADGESSHMPPRRPGRHRLVEDVVPGETPTVALEPAVRFHSNRIRAWIVLAAIGWYSFTMVGLLALILLEVPVERILVWQSATNAVTTPAAAAIGYYFSRRGSRHDHR